MSGRRAGHSLLPSRRRLVRSLERWWVFRFDRAAAAFRAASLDALDGVDLASVAALSVLADVGGMSLAALGDRVGVDRTTISRLVRVLEEDGLVDCASDPLDARKLSIHLTKTGRQTIAEAHDQLRAVEESFFATFDDYELDDLRRALRRLEPAPTWP